MTTTLHFHAMTASTPEQFIAGLTDFGSGRSKVFSNRADAYFKINCLGHEWADVTEGSTGTWERLEYEWSSPNHVVLTTIDSNVWGGASGHTYTFRRNGDGTTEVDLVSVREGKNFKGRFLEKILSRFGDRLLGSAFENSVSAIEASNGYPGSTGSGSRPSRAERTVQGAVVRSASR